MTSPLHRLDRLTAMIRRKRDERIALRFADAARQPEAAAYRQLLPHSLAFASLRPSSSVVPAVNLVLPELSFGAIFAGIRTALEVAAGLSARGGVPLRVVVLRGAPPGADRDRLVTWIRQELPATAGAAIDIVAAEWAIDAIVHPSDVWIATHWTTAHPLEVACRMGTVPPDQVLYLVQDYEPGFTAWSSEYALAEATYHAGFDLVVNSVPVQRRLADADGIVVPDDRVFRPQLDLDRLEAARRERAALAAKRNGDGEARVLFYARPTKPRNLFRIGIAALEIAAGRAAQSGISLRITSAGETHPVPSGGRLSGMTVLGKLPWDAYFSELARTDVLLSLQMSPHPSHPPLDAVLSGGRTVTNDLSGSRSGLHPRLAAVAPEPTALADALLSSLRASDDETGASAPTALLPALGSELGPVLDAAAARHGLSA